ncbi:MAG: Penicillin-binding protein, partial [Pseudomonadota bacterium]
GIQSLSESLLEARRHEFSQKQIHNATILVLDSRSAEVRAAVGNFDFWDRAHGGQIAGFWVERSPGSTLKPVLYAMGLDKRLFLPSTLVPDVPVNFRGFSPRNFDQKFNGLIAMEDALAHSLNIPFVNLLNKVGVEELLTTLRRMGVRSPKELQGYYGLSAIIGGIEITAEEIAGVYATLARGGEYLPVRWLSSREGTPLMKPVAIFDSGATWLTSQTLVIRDRPDFPNRRNVSNETGGVRWKTGTSFGQRDAWAVGYGKAHTAVVWFGNFDNSSSSALVGSETAAPLLFDLLEALDGRDGTAATGKIPPNIGHLQVCAFSGMPAGEACEQKRTVLAFNDRLPVGSCPYHVHVDVDIRTQKALTPMCRLGRKYETRSFLRLPTDVRRWLADTAQNLPESPKLADFCTRRGGNEKAKIKSPEEGQVVLLMSGIDPSQQKIALEAELPPESEQVSWFVNGKFLGSTTAHERLWWVPELGDHEVAASDENGMVSRRKFKVRAP